MGLGNDPYQSAILRIQKNQLYRYDMTWRLNDYYNPGLTVAGGLHLMDTVRRLQDHELTLFPQSKYRLRVGYSRNTQDGPALSTSLEFGQQQHAQHGLPVFANLRRQWNEYRAGRRRGGRGLQVHPAAPLGFLQGRHALQPFARVQRGGDRAAQRPDGAAAVRQGGAGARQQSAAGSAT